MSMEMARKVSLDMKVLFDDTRKNWQLWGKLVELWICSLEKRPKDVSDLIEQATTFGISNVSVPGSEYRNVVFYSYNNTKELTFMLPTEEMLMAAQKKITSGPYPLPVFYDEAYTGSRTELTAQEAKLFAACRVGEYTINNCG